VTALAHSLLDRAAHVLAVRDRFQVGWVDAAWIAAEMVDFSIFGDRPDEVLVEDSVGVSSASFDAKLAVAEVVLRASPMPAGGD